MRLLAVIPCLNEGAHLAQLIEQLLKDCSIDLLVVADGGSIDDSRDIVERLAKTDHRVRLLENPDRIQSAGVNSAVATYGSEFDWLARIDAHCRYPDKFVSMLLEAAQEKNAEAVVVPMVTVASAGFARAAAIAQNSVLGTGGSAHRHVGKGEFVDHGHHALVKLDWFRNVGGYCERMPCNEDAEFDERLRAAGGRIWLEPGCAITYFPRRSPGALWKQYFKYGQGRARNLLRHKRRPRLRQLLPLAVPLSLALSCLAPLHWIAAVPALLWVSLSLIGGLSLGMKAGGRWALLAGIAVMIMHFSWALGFLEELIRNPAGTRPAYRLATDHDR